MNTRNTMNTYATTLAAALVFVGCGEQFHRPDSRCSCEADVGSHPRAEALQRLLDRYARRGLVGLALFVDSDTEGRWLGAAGAASIEDDVGMSTCHVHHGASLAKTYLATVTLLLAERGELDLDAPIRNHLPSRIARHLPNGERATIRQLMNHSSGIPEYNDAGPYLVDTFNDPQASMSTEKRISYVYNEDALFEPGTDFAYSDTNYMLLSLIVDQVTGDHAAQIAEDILEPLALSKTYYHGVEGYPEPPCVTNNYFEKKGDGRLENISDVQLQATEDVRGADGIIASPEDFATFFSALLEGRLLSQASLDEMQQFRRTSEPDVRYGLGLARLEADNEVWLGHSGSTIGAGALVYRNTTLGVTVATFTNLGLSFPSPLAKEFYPHFWDDLRAALRE